MSWWNSLKPSRQTSMLTIGGVLLLVAAVLLKVRWLEALGILLLVAITVVDIKQYVRASHESAAGNSPQA